MCTGSGLYRHMIAKLSDTKVNGGGCFNWMLCMSRFLMMEEFGAFTKARISKKI